MVIVDYNLKVDYDGSEPENEPGAQEEKEENSDTEYVNMETTHNGTFCQRMMPCNVMQRIEWLNQEQGPKIMALMLQHMYIWLGFSPKATRLLVREQGLDSPERLRVLTNKNADDISNVVMKPSSKNANGTTDRGQQVSVIAQKPKSSCLPIPS